MTKSTQKINIKDAVIAVTYRCNSRCTMCNIWNIKKNPLLCIEDIKKLPVTLRNINISGGEPFLRPDLVEFIKAIKKQCPKARLMISSNGFATKLIEDKIKKILKVDSQIGVAISLDGMDEVHEKVRRIPNGFNKCMDTIKMLKRMGVKYLRIGFTAGDYNINELPKVYNLSRNLGIEMSLAVVHNSDNFFNIKTNKINSFDKFYKNLTWLIKQELFSFSPKRWLRAYFAYGVLYFLKTNKRILPSYAGKMSLFIDPDAEVFPSDIATVSMGNLKKHNSFDELMKSKQAQSILKQDSSKIDHSWMICTARVSISKHPWQVITALWGMVIKILLNRRLV